MSVVWLITIYILLFLDQEVSRHFRDFFVLLESSLTLNSRSLQVLTEKTNSLGTRAYLARTRAIQQRRILRAAQTAGVSTAGPFNSRRTSPPSSFTPRDEDETTQIGSAQPGPMAGGVFASRAIPKGVRPPVVEEELGGPMMVGSSQPLARRESNPSRTSRDRESMVRFAGDEEVDNRQSVVSEERDEAMDPFEDQRGGYYGYEDERGFGAQRGGCKSRAFLLRRIFSS